jgi:hypothetical protein
MLLTAVTWDCRYAGSYLDMYPSSNTEKALKIMESTFAYMPVSRFAAVLLVSW